jgi:pimeloyl-ACP methyl ester carboxylesterase
MNIKIYFYNICFFFTRFIMENSIVRFFTAGSSWWVGPAALAIITASAPFFLEATKQKLSHEDSGKALAAGEFAKLSQGVTHYKWVGPSGGAVVVVIHGLGSPSQGLSALSEQLAKTGHRVLVYDLYGRGFSDAAAGQQDRRFFLRQLQDLLVHQGVKDDLTVVGYSMGGCIATAFVSENKHRVKRLVLIAPAGITHNEPAAGSFVRLSSYLGDWLHHLIAGPIWRQGVIAQNKGFKSEVEGITEVQLSQVDKYGFLAAVLSSLRNMLREVQEPDHRDLAVSDVPVLAVWGRKDKTIPICAKDIVSSWNPSMCHEVLEDAGHGLAYSHGTEIARRIAAWSDK